MKLNKIIVLDKNEFTQKQRDELKRLAKEIIFYEDLPKDDDEAIKRIDDADAIIVCWYALSEKCVDSCENLRYLGVVATGYGWLAAEYASRKGITVTNVPGYATVAVSNFIMQSLDNLNSGKTIGIIGLGRIGLKVAEAAKNKGLNVIYWNRTKKNVEFKEVKFADIFKLSDIVVLQVKSNRETEKIIKNKNLDELKPGAIIVNVVSPKLFEDEDYLLKLVAKKKLKLILDFEEKSKLSSANKNIKYTCGVAWKSPESVFNLHQIAINNIKSYESGKIENII